VAARIAVYANYHAHPVACRRGLDTPNLLPLRSPVRLYSLSTALRAPITTIPRPHSDLDRQISRDHNPSMTPSLEPHASSHLGKTRTLSTYGISWLQSELVRTGHRKRHTEKGISCDRTTVARLTSTRPRKQLLPCAPHEDSLGYVITERDRQKRGDQSLESWRENTQRGGITKHRRPQPDPPGPSIPPSARGQEEKATSNTTVSR
jgi:hypothetical protein